jgi:hypothetical protein
MRRFMQRLHPLQKPIKASGPPRSPPSRRHWWLIVVLCCWSDAWMIERGGGWLAGDAFFHVLCIGQREVEWEDRFRSANEDWHDAFKAM